MPGAEEYQFKIDAYTPETIPMARLAEYMGDLAKLLGEPAAVHFVRIDASSTVLVHRVDPEAVPKVEERIDGTRRGDGPPDALAAYERLNHKLRNDNGSGALQRATGAQILEFRGQKDAEPTSFGAFWQESTIDGIAIKLGGRQDPVPVHIQSGSMVYSTCQASLTLARKLKHHMFDDDLRFYGNGKWLRDEGGHWILERFNIRNFELLDSKPLTEVVTELRSVRGSEWDQLKDPWGELDEIRNGLKGPQGGNVP